jgi:predicted transcriptional regulator YdeE
LVLKSATIYKQKVLSQFPLALSQSPFWRRFKRNQLCVIKFLKQKMETTTIENEKSVMYIEAASFPNGVGAAHEKLHGIVPFSVQREYYGISWMEQGKTRYLAAVGELHETEAEKYALEKFTIKKGSYICDTVHDFMKHIPAIGECFQRMLVDPRIDPQGYCLEIYEGDDVRCLVKLQD